MSLALLSTFVLLGADADTAESASAPVEATEAAVEATPEEASAAGAPTPQERAQVFVRFGDQLGQRGQWSSQLKAYRRALELDPRLAQDPMFVQRFERAYQADRRLAQAQPQKPPARPFIITPGRPQPQQPVVRYYPPRQPRPGKVVARPRETPLRSEPYKPREGRYIGAAAFVGPQAIAGVGITTFLFQHLQLSVIGDMYLPAVTVDAKVHILRFAITPYVGGGVHLALPFDVQSPPSLGLYKTGYLYASIGANWMTSFGLFFDASISIAPGLDATPGRIGHVAIIPGLSIGWAFRPGPIR